MKEYKLYVHKEGDQPEQYFLVMNDNGKHRECTREEMERAITILNEEGNNIVKLFCQNPDCDEHKRRGFIERTRANVQKHVYGCDTCGKPMSR